MDVKVGSIYKHFNGKRYIVENIATHTETEEKMVVYRALYGEGKVWVRPYNMFVEEVKLKSKKHRFELEETITVDDLHE